MKKFAGVWLVVAVVSVIFISGCMNSPAGPTQTISPTITMTVTPSIIATITATMTPTVPDNNTYINVIIQKNETTGMSICQFAAYACDGTGATLASTAISMSGPGGALPGSLTSGVFIYQDMTGASFVHDAQYAVSVTLNAVNYYATVSTNGAITIAADGSTVTWGYDADVEQITVTKMSPVTFLFYGPVLSSPFDLVAAGAYAAGSGSYSIGATMTDQKAMAVSAGTEVVAGATIQHMNTLQVTR